MISIITPAFNERANLPLLHDRLEAALVSAEWEWIIVDDHSQDDTFALVEALASRDARVRGIRLARNSGSHVAIACGLQHATGDAAAMVVADLQDPPELLNVMIDRWRAGTQLVWAVRRQRARTRESWFPALYYWIVRHLLGLPAMPPGGVDFFLADRLVVDAFLSRVGPRVSVFVLLMSLGFRQGFVEYEKQPRVRGRSGWSLSRKATLVFDSIVSVSNFPLRWMTHRGSPRWPIQDTTKTLHLKQDRSAAHGVRRYS